LTERAQNKQIRRQLTERRWFFFSKTRNEAVYLWFDYIKANAREQESFEHGGAAMVEFQTRWAKAVKPGRIGLMMIG
jgi:hypothetical protein